MDVVEDMDDFETQHRFVSRLLEFAALPLVGTLGQISAFFGIYSLQELNDRRNRRAALATSHGSDLLVSLSISFSFETASQFERNCAYRDRLLHWIYRDRLLRQVLRFRRLRLGPSPAQGWEYELRVRPHLLGSLTSWMPGAPLQIPAMAEPDDLLLSFSCLPSLRQLAASSPTHGLFACRERLIRLEAVYRANEFGIACAWTRLSQHFDWQLVRPQEDRLMRRTRLRDRIWTQERPLSVVLARHSDTHLRFPELAHFFL